MKGLCLFPSAGNAKHCGFFVSFVPLQKTIDVLHEHSPFVAFLGPPTPTFPPSF